MSNGSPNSGRSSATITATTTADGDPAPARAEEPTGREDERDTHEDDDDRRDEGKPGGKRRDGRPGQRRAARRAKEDPRLSTDERREADEGGQQQRADRVVRHPRREQRADAAEGDRQGDVQQGIGLAGRCRSRPRPRGWRGRPARQAAAIDQAITARRATGWRRASRGDGHGRRLGARPFRRRYGPAVEPDALAEEPLRDRVPGEQDEDLEGDAPARTAGAPAHGPWLVPVSVATSNTPCGPTTISDSANALSGKAANSSV